MRKFGGIVIGWIFICSLSHAQPALDTAGISLRTPYTIKEVFILGNKTTKPNIIYREMGLKKGVTFSDSIINEMISVDEMRIYNTNLFNEVEIEKLYSGQGEMMLVVKVTERWYIFPSVIFKLADRNFNDWWVNQNHDLSRVNLGIRYQQYNFRGRRELLDLTFQLGFERKFAVGWRIPYIEKSQKHGLTFNYTYEESRNAGYRTENHVRQFINAERLLVRSTDAGIKYMFRNTYYNHHRFEISFNHMAIDDTVQMLNPNFFNDNADRQDNFNISYQFTRDLRNNINYATSGYLFDLKAEKLGIGIFNDVDIFTLQLVYNQFFDLGNDFSYAMGIKGFSSWPENQSYANFFSLGFEQTLVRGYEQDLIEGHKFVLYKSTFRKRLFKHIQDISPLMPIKQFQRVPFAVYAKVFADAGYIENYPQYEISRRLSNSLLYGVGAGIDVVTLYDLVIRFEYSVNAENQFRLALNSRADF